MNDPRRLSRYAFIVIIVIVGAWLIVSLPPPEKIGQTPSSPIITFNVDHWVTEVHRNLKRARRAEIKGDVTTKTSRNLSVESYQLALEYFRTADDYAKRYSPGGYIDELITDSVGRVKKKIQHRTD